MQQDELLFFFFPAARHGGGSNWTSWTSIFRSWVGHLTQGHDPFLGDTTCRMFHRLMLPVGFSIVSYVSPHHFVAPFFWSLGIYGDQWDDIHFWLLKRETQRPDCAEDFVADAESQRPETGSARTTVCVSHSEQWSFRGAVGFPHWNVNGNESFGCLRDDDLRQKSPVPSTEDHHILILK